MRCSFKIVLGCPFQPMGGVVKHQIEYTVVSYPKSVVNRFQSRARKNSRSCGRGCIRSSRNLLQACPALRGETAKTDRKSTRLNSSHVAISYAVFCLKKKTEKNNN